MSPMLKHMRTAVLCALVLAVTAGALDAQDLTKGRTKKRTHRMFAAQIGPDEVALVWDEVPGATEYRVYLPDPAAPGPPSPTTRPWTTGSASSRRVTVAGVKRMAAGAYLEAVAGRTVLFRGTFEPVARAPLARPSAPAGIAAAESGAEEVTVSWDAVPGATAYRLGRAVGGGGFQMLCDLCPPEPVFVDTAATPGLDHTYTVEAIFPLGPSERTISDPITVGAAQLAAASAPSTAAWNKPMSSGTPVPGTAADYSNAGAGSGAVPPTGGVTPPTGGAFTPPTGTSTVTCPPGTVPATTLPKTAVVPDWNKPMASGTPVPGTAADNSNVGAAGGTTGTGTTAVTCIPATTGQPTGTGYPPAGQPGTVTPTYTPPGQPGTATPTYTPPGQPGTATPTYTPPGQPGTVTPTYTPPGQPAGTLPTYPPAGLPAGTVPGATQPVTASPNPSGTALEGIWVLALRIQDQLASLASGVAAGAVTVHSATPVSSGTTSLAPMPAAQVSAWLQQIQANLSQLTGSLAARVAAGGTVPHATTPVSTGTAANDPVLGLAHSVMEQVRNLLGGVAATAGAASPAASPLATLTDRIRGDVTALMGSFGIAASFGSVAAGAGTGVHAATPISTATPPATTTPATTTPVSTPPAAATPASCRLDYQRADNMWAAFGRPDGQLGTESITLAAGQHRVFVTDWKYEKLRNDGTNYYGSHLRIATNRTGRPIRLQIRIGTGTTWLRLEPNSTKQLAADLVEVVCDY